MFSETKWLAFLLIQISLAFAGIIRLEAENAHSIGSTKQHHSGFSGTGYVIFANQGDYTIFTTNIPSDGTYPVTLGYAASEESTFSVRANGHQLFSIQLSSSSTLHTMEVALRQGVNTIVLMKEKDASSVRLDYLEIIGAHPLAARGATLAYVEYEAEDATHNGVGIGPDRSYMTLPSEASGRKAVQVKSGQSVDFTLKAAATGIVVRLSIPDSSDGNGLTGYLGVNVGGQQVLNLTVTSRYSWTYGSYPFTNNPGDGQGHHFYDETRGIFPSNVASGTKVSLIPLTSDFTYTIDLADFYVVPAPYSQPSGSLDVVTYGADPSGKSDSTQAFIKALTEGQASNQVVWIPRGTFLVNQIITVNGVTLRGAGPWYSNVQATVPHGVGFFGNWAPNPSVNVQLYDFAMWGDTFYRDDNVADSGTGGAITKSIFQNLWIEHTKCGMWLDGPFDGLHIVSTTMRNHWADGINFHKGVTNSVVEQCILRNTGDDGLAMWSDTNADANNVFQFNTIQIPILANGIAIYGGTNNSATDNYVADTLCEGGALQVGNRFSSTPVSGTTSFARTTSVRCGAPNRYNSSHNGALWVWPEQGAMNDPVLFNDIEFIDSSYSAITFWGSSLTDCHFTNITVTGGPHLGEVNSISGNAYFTDTVATGLTVSGLSTCDSGFTFVMVSGCSGWNTTCCNC